MNSTKQTDLPLSKKKRDNQAKKELEEEKVKLKKEIAQLQDVISEVDFAINSTTFGQIKFNNQSSSSSSSQNSNLTKHTIIQNVEAILMQKLFKFSGNWVAKITNDIYVFEFSSSSDYSSPYAVEFMITDEKPTLKRWVLPWGIDISLIQKVSPLQKITDIIPFLKLFKKHIICHSNREEQFKTLQKLVSTMKNIQIHATMSYTRIECQFLRVDNKSTESKVNIIVTLIYDSNMTRPRTVIAEWNLKHNPREEVLVNLKSFVKSFRNSTLATAVEQISAINHPMFAWTPEESTDELADIEDDTTSEGESSDDENYSPLPRSVKTKKRSRKRARRAPTPESDEPVENPDSINENDVPELYQNTSQVEEKPKKTQKKTKKTSARKLRENNVPKPSQNVSHVQEKSKKTTKKTKKVLATKPDENDEPQVSEIVTGKRKRQENETIKTPPAKVRRKARVKSSKKLVGQTELSFKGVPIVTATTVNEELTKSTGRITRRSNLTSTPAVPHLRRRPNQPFSHLEISPIASNQSTTDITKTKQPKTPGKKKKIT